MLGPAPLYASPDWDKKRITELQQAWMRERIELARLRAVAMERPLAKKGGFWLRSLGGPDFPARLLEAVQRRRR